MEQHKKYRRLTQRDMDIAVQELLKRFIEDSANGKFHVGRFFRAPEFSPTITA